MAEDQVLGAGDQRQHDELGPDQKLKPIRVLLLLPSLAGGGAERVAICLMRYCQSSRLDMHMGLLVKSGRFLQEVCADRLTVSPIGARFLKKVHGPSSASYRPSRLLPAALLAPLNIRLMIRRNRPDIIVTFLKGTCIATYFGLFGLWGRRRPRWITREGNDVWAGIKDEIRNPLGRWFISRLLRRAYRASDVCLTSSQALGVDMATWLGRPLGQVRVVYNMADVAQAQLRARERASVPAQPFLVTAGRLEYQKGHDLLLRAFAASEGCRTRRLVILGEGTRLQALSDQARDLGIADRVDFPGFVDNPWAYYAAAELFVLPSRWEGFGNVVAEAIAVGAPCLVTDCKYGPDEIVEHGSSGWVVASNDVAALTDAIDLLLENGELRRKLSSGGMRRAARFDADNFAAAYATMFAEVANR